MTVLNSLSSSGAKPGVGFSAKGIGGFQGKLHSAIEKNSNSLGVLKHNPEAVAALHSQVLKNQHLIRKGGLSQYQTKKLMSKITSEVHIKGGHISAAQHEALEKLGHHLTKMDLKKDLVHQRAMEENSLTQNHGISSISQTQRTSTISQIGDKTVKISGQENLHAAGSIADILKNKNNNFGNGSIKPTTAKPPSIKLSI